MKKQEEFQHAGSGDVDIMRWKFQPWRDGDGEVGGIILFSEILTESLRAQREAEDSRARYRAMFDQTNVGVARAGLDWKFFEVNEAACRIAGRSRAEMLTLKPQDFTPPEDWAGIEIAAQAALASQAPMPDFEVRTITGQGETRWVRVNLSLVRDGN